MSELGDSTDAPRTDDSYTVQTDGGEDEDESLAEEIRRKLIIDEPDEDALVLALEDAISIVRGSWRLVVGDGMDEREPKDQVFTYLLGKYAANRVSDGTAPLEATREELRQHFDRELIDEVADHGWIRVRHGNLSIRPSFYQHTADELAERYGGGRDE